MTLEDYMSDGHSNGAGHGNGHGGHGKKTIEDALTKGPDEIIAYFQEATGSGFKDRLEKFAEFYNPNYKVADVLTKHAEYAVIGKPGEEAKGAYHIARKTLDGIVKDDMATLNEKQVTQVLESYVDGFLKNAVPDIDARLKKAKDAGLTDEQLRNLKGQLFEQFHPGEQPGSAINPLSQDFINQLRGKQKIEVYNAIRSIADTSKTAYARHLQSSAISNLLRGTDRMDLAEEVQKVMEGKGLQHDDHPYTRPTAELAREYRTGLAGGNVQELGWGPKKPKAAHGAHAEEHAPAHH